MTKAILFNKVQGLIYKNGERVKDSDNFSHGRKISLVAKLFGCRHGNMGRPFSNGVTTYRSCLNCGARRQFNPDTMETHGTFYFPPVIERESINNI